MRKLVVVVSLLGVGLLAVVLWLHFRPQRVAPPVAGLELRAMMRDEDAPRPIEPSIGLQVNDDVTGEVFKGAPLWLMVGVNNAAAANEIAAARAILERLGRMPAKAPATRRLLEDWALRADPAKITLGDAAHPWTAAVQLLVRDGQGGERAWDIPMPVIGSPAGVVELGAYDSARAIWGTASAAVSLGSYSLVACLGPTGSWRGRVCSQPTPLNVRELPAQPTPEQQDALDELRARFALLAGDVQGLEESGRKLLAAHPDGVSGHMYLGEANFRQGKWVDALAQFTAARAAFARAQPTALEPPRFIIVRMNQVMQRIYDAP
jgi:hypothetical protein